jgi:AraC-like DNA-binding protein
VYDVLTEILSVLQLHSSIYCQSQIDRRDWSLHFQPINGATFHIVSAGACWAKVGEAEIALNEGDLLVLPHGTAHLIADHLAAPICASIDLDDGLEDPCRVMRWGAEDTGTTLVCGLFRFSAGDGLAGLALLSLLPAVMHFPAANHAANGLESAIHALIDEANADRQGKLALLHRLADVLFVQLLRAWLCQPDAEMHGWLAGLRDPQIAASLSLMHANPAQHWTVEALATHAAMSRSAFAARFTDLVGMPPATYLVHWRMQLAVRLLQNPRLSITQVAERVGYTSDIAFSKAFKRLHGRSPAVFRRQSQPGQPGQPAARSG